MTEVTMTAATDTPAKLHQVAARLSDASRHLTAALSCVSAAMSALHQAPFEAPLKTPLKGHNAPHEDSLSLAAWRAAHRRGRPSRIASDPEVEAFVLDRIEVMTYAEIVAAVAESFPKARHISSSGLQRWWAKRRPAVG